MITGRSSGSGKYSFHERSYGAISVHVAQMPEEMFRVRVVFRQHGETKVPVLSLTETEAELLWASLSAMAKDQKWEDRLITEDAQQVSEVKGSKQNEKA